RLMARSMRSESERRAAEHLGVDADVDAATALRWMALAAADVMVHGHTHRPGTDALAPGQVRHVLSDWHLDPEGATRAEVLRRDAHGWTRLRPAEAARPVA
ncbi:MAG: UDP-2,3-diacylglucosamine diphosphatase, partial [Pseudomonadota bacterium]|nr:UDP-2,3-diacylglucosamine diphosphatase [Pseudomonadota bacterium]